jgi:hypothetical protein
MRQAPGEAEAQCAELARAGKVSFPDLIQTQEIADLRSMRLDQRIWIH